MTAHDVETETSRAVIDRPYNTRKETAMYPYSEILRALGRIEGELIQIRKLSERVSALEQAQSWLKGGCAILTAAVLYMIRGISGK